MIKGFVAVTAGVDKTADIQRSLRDIAKMQVYVGIPDGSGNERPKDGEGGDITNAELLYIHTHGVRQKEMREEMNPAIESGERTYSQAYQLYIQSHGSPLWHSPPRPVLEPAIEKNRDAIAKQLQKAVSTALDGHDASGELEKAGMLGQNIARGWFTDPSNGWAPNSPLTVENKGSDKPLIDTAEMRKSITYVVDKDGSR
ncbi:hypothetical protein [Paenibacillus ginsengarvi]|uniref:Uncharacterized protein n=1 Tax=Paenibacillus ginsengarvi TaxID=400777 RepID=A0A3B0BNR3_9BACL|nr:hypothetical protein [Paenibacillus ginsengarvi]RKN75005.1 hypothetical protein D7M11_26065 [Paenibacillus ginsengarvi]